MLRLDYNGPNGCTLIASAFSVLFSYNHPVLVQIRPPSVDPHDWRIYVSKAQHTNSTKRHIGIWFEENGIDPDEADIQKMPGGDITDWLNEQVGFPTPPGEHHG